MKRLVVTADDVGLHRGMTDGALAAHRNGVVTACSVVANGAAFDHAVERLRDCPSLAIGVHLTLVEERPISQEATSLLASNGLFYENYLAFIPRFEAGRIRIEDIERELRLQIERVMAEGLPVVHLNGHQHLHLLPRIFELVQRLAAEYAVPYVRIVDEARQGWSFRAAAIAALSVIGRAARKRARVETNQGSIGVGLAGSVTSSDLLIDLLDEVSGLTELVCHPGVGNAELSLAYHWNYQWDAETSALCDPRLRRAIEARGIQLVQPGPRLDGG